METALLCTNTSCAYHIVQSEMDVAYAFTNKPKMTIHLNCASDSIGIHHLAPIPFSLNYKLNTCYT